MYQQHRGKVNMLNEMDASGGRAAGRPSLVRSMAVFASGTFLSRIFGLVRDIAMAALIPAAARASFLVAFRIPNTFRGLVAEGAANAAYVPVMSEHIAQDGRTSLRPMLGSLKLATLCIVGLLTLVAMGAAPYLIEPIQWLTRLSRGAGFSAEETTATATMLRWVFPYLLLVALAAVSMAGLNSVHHFAAPSIAPVLLNLGIILACVLLAHRTVHPGYALVIGVLLGGMAQLVLQDVTLAVKGMAPTYQRPFVHPALGKMGLLLLPALIGHGVVEINALVDTFFAGSLGPAAVNGLYYANRLAQLPMGVFGVAIATTALPALAGSFSRGDTEEGMRTFNEALGLGLFFTIPAAMALIVFGAPIIRLLFEYGNFDAAATSHTVGPLMFYGLGLASFAGAKTTVSALYGLQRPRVPVTIAAVCMVVNIGLNVVLVRPMQQSGLALATALSSTLNWVLLLVALRRHVGRLGGRRLAVETSKTFGAAHLAVGIGWIGLVALRSAAGDTSPASFMLRFVYVAAPLSMTGISYAILCRLFGVQAFGRILATIKRDN